jgi:hypothetical protein
MGMLVVSAFCAPAYPMQWPHLARVEASFWARFLQILQWFRLICKTCNQFDEW